MTYTLSELLLDTYAALGELNIHTATGGGLATLQDESLFGLTPPDAWARGALIALSGGSAPAGEFVPIRASADVPGAPGYAEFTTARNFSAPVTDGLGYALLSAAYPLDTLIELANTALGALGYIASYADAPVAAGMSLSLPGVAWNGAPPQAVEIAQGDGWVRSRGWQYLAPLAGEDGAVVFHEPVAPGLTARVWSVARHPRIRQHDDAIAPSVAPELALAAATERALAWKAARVKGGDPGLFARWESARAALDDARTRFPIWTPARAGRLLHLTLGVG
jgi:hypothetical protein